MSPEAWRLAMDATVGVTDTWQAALAILKFIHEQFKYESQSNTLRTHTREVLQERATHAWVEVLVPGVGWIGLDPTHNRAVDDTCVKIAVGRDYADVPPVAGNYKGTTDCKLDVKVEIRHLE